MVTPRWRVGASSLTVLLLASLMTTGLPAIPASHSYGNGFHVPAEGMQVEMTLPLGENYTFTLTFGSPTERIVGHHEWRDVVATQTTLAFGNETYSYGGELYDLMTGQNVGAHYESSVPIVGPLLAWNFQVSNSGSTLASLFWSNPLPESYAWGRSLWPGSSWTVPTVPLFGQPTQTTVTVLGEYHHGAPVDLVVESRAGEASGLATSWSIRGANSLSPFGAERSFSYGWYNEPGNITWLGTFDVPITIIAEGGEPLPFEGFSEATIVAERDQTLRYGPVGFLPYDPEPHHLFDVHEAARIAWDLDLGALHAFKARAVDPYLAEAEMNRGATPTDVHWRLRFEEAGRTAVIVALHGVKVPGQPLTPVDTSGEGDGMRSDPILPDTRAAMEVAALGDLARLADDVVPGILAQVRGYAWSVYGWNQEATASFGFDYQGPTGALLVDSHTVRSDALRGIVTSSVDFVAQSPVVIDALETVDEAVPLP